MEAHRQFTVPSGMLLAGMAKKATPKQPTNPREWHQLRAIRNAKKLSQEKLAEAIGLSQGMISQLESGESDYTRNHLEKLAKFFNVDQAELVGDVATGDPVYRLLREFPPEERHRAVEVLKSLKRAAENE